MITPTKQLFNWQEPEVIAQGLIDTWGEAGFIWLDGDGRIHERLNYRKKNGNWEKELLYPQKDLLRLKLVKFCKIFLSSLSGKIANAS